MVIRYMSENNNPVINYTCKYFEKQLTRVIPLYFSHLLDYSFYEWE